MARKSPRKRKTAKKAAHRSSGRPIWTGSIDFGLVNIPVKLYSAQNSAGLDFDLLDKRDFSRIRYRRVNEKTGKEVDWRQIVKGYQYEKGEYVALSDEDFARANVEASQSIAIVRFVDAAAVSPFYYDTPYYLEPLKNGRRAYALLRTVIQKTGKVGIAKIVLRTRQHLAALIPHAGLLVLNTLRYAHELRDPSSLAVPEDQGRKSALPQQELKMAEQLIDSMAGDWDPAQYRDDYHDDLLKLVAQKVKSGKTKTISPAAAPKPKRDGKVIDIMHLLRQSVKQAQSKEAPARSRKAG
jgi:DNA end-binding protein Ku